MSTTSTGIVPTTSYTIHLPISHPPYENPIQGHFPFHFDTSPMKDFLTPKNETLTSQFTKEFGKKWKSLTKKRFNPPLDAFLEVKTCVTAAARAMVEGWSDRQPEESPPFFAVTVAEFEGRDMWEVFRGLRELLEGEFEKEVWPELWESGGVIIRFFAMGEDAVF